MSTAVRRWLGVLLGVCVLLVGSALAERATLLSDLESVQAEGAVLERHLDAAVAASAAWDDTLAERRDVSARFDRLLAARKDFVGSLGGADAAFGSAAGKVDITAQRAAVTSLQDAVLAERSDAAIVTAAAQQVEATAAGVTAAVAAFDAEQARIAEAARRAASRSGGSHSSASVGTRLPSAGSAYDRVRAALDRVGGGGIPLEEYNGACGTVSAAACASPSGVIRFTAGIADWSSARLHWVMAHELAHIHQFRVWGAMTASAGYASLFNGNPELLANCMAQQRGYGSANVSCSGAQIEWGAAIWRGSVPG